jgi:hypothetical protein
VSLETAGWQEKQRLLDGRRSARPSEYAQDLNHSIIFIMIIAKLGVLGSETGIKRTGIRGTIA